MEFFSAKESDKDQADFSNILERLHNSGDCILNDFMEFPQCSLETHTDNLDSLDLMCKTETDYINPKPDAPQAVEYRSSIDDKMDAIANGSFQQYFSSDSLPEESSYRDILSSYEMSVCEDINLLDMNTSTLDVLDYIEDVGSTLNMMNKSATNCNACWEQDTFSSNECFDVMGNNFEYNNDKRLCLGQACCSQTLDSHDLSTANTKLEPTSVAASQSNIFHTLGTFENKEQMENKDIYYLYNGLFWTDPQDKKDLHIGQFNGAKLIPASDVDNTNTQTLTIDEPASVLRSSNFQMTATGGCIVEQSKNTEQLSGLQLVSKSNLNLHQQNVQSVDQKKKYVPVFCSPNTVHSSVTADKGQLPFSSDINADLQNTNSDLKMIIPSPNTKSNKLDETDNRYIDKPNSVIISNSHVSNAQTSKPVDPIHTVTNKGKKFMKVGKRDRFITMPVENVNKLMVRDLLSMSGNREDMSMKEWTQEYRTNIRMIIQQKRKRLNIV